MSEGPGHAPAERAGAVGERGGRLARALGAGLGVLLFCGLLFWPDVPLDSVQRRAAAVTALTATLWVTVAIPIGATSLLPAVLFPLLGVMTPGETAPNYMQDLVQLFLGAFVIALGMARWNVHRRIALWIVAQVGTQPSRLVLGFMCAAAFLSLWISNTATTLLMLPIALAVIGTVSGDGVDRRQGDRFALCLLLGTAYAASLGGVGTPVGTAPNQVFLGILEARYPNATVALFMAVLCFAIPVDRKRGVYLMDWRTASKLPWEVILLFGAGFSIAAAFKSSGLDGTLGQLASPWLRELSPFWVVFFTALFLSFLTELTSNTATTAVLLPVGAAAAIQSGLDPLVVIAPATIGASAAFMVPVATPPNAVVFGSRMVPPQAMARVGSWLNLVTVVLITLVFQFWVRRVWEISEEVPAWAGQ